MSKKSDITEMHAGALPDMPVADRFGGFAMSSPDREDTRKENRRKGASPTSLRKYLQYATAAEEEEDEFDEELVDDEEFEDDDEYFEDDDEYFDDEGDELDDSDAEFDDDEIDPEDDDLEDIEDEDLDDEEFNDEDMDDEEGSDVFNFLSKDDFEDDDVDDEEDPEEFDDYDEEKELDFEDDGEDEYEWDFGSEEDLEDEDMDDESEDDFDDEDMDDESEDEYEWNFDDEDEDLEDGEEDFEDEDMDDEDIDYENEESDNEAMTPLRRAIDDFLNPKSKDEDPWDMDEWGDDDAEFEDKYRAELDRFGPRDEYEDDGMGWTANRPEEEEEEDFEDDEFEDDEFEDDEFEDDDDYDEEWDDDGSDYDDEFVNDEPNFDQMARDMVDQASNDITDKIDAIDDATGTVTKWWREQVVKSNTPPEDEMDDMEDEDDGEYAWDIGREQSEYEENEEGTTGQAAGNRVANTGPTKIDRARQKFQQMINQQNVTRGDIIAAFVQDIDVTQSTAVSYYERLAKEAGLTGDEEPFDAGMGRDDEKEFDPMSAYPTMSGKLDAGMEDDPMMDDGDRTGVIRQVDNAHLVYKRQMEDGTFEELWIYNIQGNVRDDVKIRHAILSGTDIPKNKTQSEDGNQKYHLETMGNAQMMHISGLPN